LADDQGTVQGGALLGVGLSSTAKSGKNAKGARVAHVNPGSPAATAGLQEGDIITAMGGMAITGPKGVSDVVGAHKPGDHVPLTYLRDGKSKTVDVTLAARPGNNFFGDLDLLPDSDMAHMWKMPWGMQPEAHAYLGVRPGLGQEEAGALVGGVEPGTAAAKMGIEKGDRITRLNDKDVADFADLAQQVAAQAPGDSISVTVMRGGKKQQLHGTLGEREDDLAWGGGMPGMRSFNLQGVGPDLQKQIDQLQEQMEQFRKQLEDLKAEPGQ
jgi:serine protease Do